MSLRPHFACFSAAAFMAGTTLCATAQIPLLKESPFLPTSGPGVSAAAQEDYQLVGATATSRGPEVCIYDVQAKHSQWLAMGARMDGLQVLSFDPAQDQAAVRVNGAPRTLQLRKPVVQSAPVVVAPVGVAYDPSKPVVGITQPADGKSVEELRQEREARMMVSDLLDIGIQQRKAYEEAQKKAEAEAQKTKTGS